MKTLFRFTLVALCSFMLVGCGDAPMSPLAPTASTATVIGLALEASPAAVFFGGSTTTVTTRLRGEGAILAGRTVRFTSSGGRLSRESVTTDASGIATVDLTADATSTVTAHLEGDGQQSLTVEARAPFTVSADVMATATGGGNGPFSWQALISIRQPSGFVSVPRPSQVRFHCGTGVIQTLPGFVGDQSVTCIVSTRGTYMATVEAQTASGWQTRTELRVNVDPYIEPISVRLDVGVEAAQLGVGQVAHFHAVLLPDWRMGAVYRFDFGDGTVVEMNGFETTHVYMRSGTYTPSVTVKHVDGRTVMATSKPITITL